MRFLTALILSCSTVFLGCDNKKEIVVERHFVQQGNALPAPSQIEHVDGGVDGGGGNGVEGKPLESYRRDISTISGYSLLYDKVILPLRTKLPHLAADLLHVGSERSWYLIPVRLNRIPSFKIGVNFKTDQLAIQNLSEIWLDEQLYPANQVDQAALLLHELLMGVRLIEFQNSLDQCLADIAIMKLDPANQGAYQANRVACFKKNRHSAEIGDTIGIRKPIRLIDDDYETIRILGRRLLEDIGTLDADELESWMVIRNFRKY